MWQGTCHWWLRSLPYYLICLSAIMFTGWDIQCLLCTGVFLLHSPNSLNYLSCFCVYCWTKILLHNICDAVFKEYGKIVGKLIDKVCEKFYVRLKCKNVLKNLVQNYVVNFGYKSFLKIVLKIWLEELDGEIVWKERVTKIIKNCVGNVVSPP